MVGFFSFFTPSSPLLSSLLPPSSPLLSSSFPPLRSEERRVVKELKFAPPLPPPLLLPDPSPHFDDGTVEVEAVGAIVGFRLGVGACVGTLIATNVGALVGV